HSVTALYEVVPVGAEAPEVALSAPLKYQSTGAPTPASEAPELATVRVRYKLPMGETSTELEHVVTDSSTHLAQASEDHRFATAVAGAALLLREAPHLGSLTLQKARALAAGALGADPEGERRELIR